MSIPGRIFRQAYRTYMGSSWGTTPLRPIKDTCVSMGNMDSWIGGTMGVNFEQFEQIPQSAWGRGKLEPEIKIHDSPRKCWTVMFRVEHETWLKGMVATTSWTNNNLFFTTSFISSAKCQKGTIAVQSLWRLHPSGS